MCLRAVDHPAPSLIAMRIDAHQHFWHYAADQYPWIPADSPLQRDWLPADLATLQDPLGFRGSIAVQARQTTQETEWLLQLAAEDPRLLGVVGWVDLRNEAVGDDLRQFAQDPHFVGVRHVVQDEPDEDFLLRPDFLRGIGRLQEHGLTYDLLIYPHQLAAATGLVTRFPDQRFVLDHLAKPAIRDREFDQWATQIRMLAKHVNVWCKVSGLVTEADPARLQPEDLRPYFDLAIEAFGPERLMFGSDWPVCLLAADYPRVVELAEACTTTLDPAARDAFFGGNAERFYLRRR